jgi:TfoX/Sxy family transcriptional regulator of competence genes
VSGSYELALHVRDLLAPLEGIELRRFFGGWSLTCDERQFAIVMDQLYLRVDDDLRAALVARGCTPFSYRSGERRIVVGRYYSAPSEAVDGDGGLQELAQAAIAAA